MTMAVQETTVVYVVSTLEQGYLTVCRSAAAAAAAVVVVDG